MPANDVTVVELHTVPARCVCIGGVDGGGPVATEHDRTLRFSAQRSNVAQHGSQMRQARARDLASDLVQQAVLRARDDLRRNCLEFESGDPFAKP